MDTIEYATFRHDTVKVENGLIGDKQQSKVADLAKYVYLPEVGTFQVSISVTKSWLFYTKIVIIYLNKYQLCFYKKD